MKSDIKYGLALLLIFLFLFPQINTNGQPPTSSSIAAKSKSWELIDTFFSPPEKWEEEYGDFRSPLRFYNGDTVRNSQDWDKRREEIREIWMDMMGHWPPFMTDQSLEIIDSVHRENFIQFTIEFFWTPNDKTRGYLLVPDEKGQKPAVITLYYEPETAIGLSDLPNRDFALQLARRGFVTLSLGTTIASEAKTYALYYPNIDHAEVEPLSMLGYAAANAWYALAKWPDVDSTRIGVMGHSFGGKWAMFASCLFDRFACSVWSDPGIVFQNDRPSINYWEPWYLGYHPPPWRARGLITKSNPARGLYPVLMENGFNLQDLHALMAPRPFLVSGGSEDPPSRWIPLNHSIRINNLLGYSDRVAMENRPNHGPTEESNTVIYLFFEHFLN